MGMNKPAAITAYVDADTLATVEQLAAAQGRTAAEFAAEAIQRVAEGEAEYRAFVQVGIDAADRGELIDQDEMEAWFEERRRQAAAE